MYVKRHCKHSDPACAKCVAGRAYSAAWRKRHPERHAAARMACADKQRANEIAWRKKNPARRRAAAAASSKLWRERRPTYYRDYYLAHKDIYLARTYKRRARGPSAMSKVSVDAIARAQCGLCYLCGFSMGADVTLDHVIPLSAGGWHSDSNAAACHRSCNTTKRDRSLLVSMIRYPKFHKAPSLEGIVRTA